MQIYTYGSYGIGEQNIQDRPNGSYQVIFVARVVESSTYGCDSVASLEVLLLVFCPWATIKTPEVSTKSWLVPIDVYRDHGGSWLVIILPVKLGSTIPFYTANNPGLEGWSLHEPLLSEGTSRWSSEGRIERWSTTWDLVIISRGGISSIFVRKKIDAKSPGPWNPAMRYANVHWEWWTNQLEVWDSRRLWKFTLTWVFRCFLKFLVPSHGCIQK